MGIIIGKFRKKKTTYEVLDKLDNEIKSIEEFRRSTEQTQKKMVGRFIFISICVYIITALIFYFYFFPATLYERFLYIIPLIILPVLLVVIKRILSWYYNRMIKKNQKKLTVLKDEKKKLLDEVMEKETYKVAKTILDKFAPEQVKKSETTFSTPARSQFTPTLGSMVPTGIRYRGGLGQTPGPQGRQLFTQLTTPGPNPNRALMAPPNSQLRRPSPNQSVMASGNRRGAAGTPLPMPRGVLPRERTVLDKMVDYLVGDGPSNRYALICRNCSSHNGMALKEEFDYLSFRCCYCMNFNPARKKRPSAPKLETTLPIKSKLSDNSSDSEKRSESDSDVESAKEPIITEPQDTAECDRKSEGEVRNSDTESNPMDVDSHPEGDEVASISKPEEEKEIPVTEDLTKD